MRFIARLVCHRGWAAAVVVVSLLVSGAGLLTARSMEHEDDLLAFLPSTSPEVRLFHEINKRFGGLDVALVGIHPDNVFSATFLGKLRKLTRTLKDTHGLDHVLTLANAMDFTPDKEKGGIITSLLVDKLPRTPAEEKALRAKVLSRHTMVGNLVSANGEAVLLYAYLAYGSDPKALAHTIRAAVQDAYPRAEVHYGGGPFISTYIYTTTQDDMRRLTPWAVLAIVLIMLLAFRDVVGTALALLSTAMGIAISLGTMSALGVKFNIVLGAMPVILFAVGSAYAIHVLSHYYHHSQHMPVPRALRVTLVSVGPTVLAAGLTTAASLLSFVWMDIRPLRTFGIFTALGITATLGLSLTFVPAVVRLTGIHRKHSESRWLRSILRRVATLAVRRRVWVGVGMGLVSAAGLVLATRVDTRVDESTFFSANSPPARAERFLNRYFGGSQFMQLYLRGDMTDPAVLREVQALADEIRLLPHVSSTLHLGLALGQVNEILVGQARIPDTRAQVRMLYSFLAGDPSAAQLVSPDRKQALMHVKLDTGRAALVEPLIARVEALVRRRVPDAGLRRLRVGSRTAGDLAWAQVRALVARRILVLERIHGVTPGQGGVHALEAALSRASEARPAPAKVAHRVARFLTSEECAVELPEGVDPLALGKAMAALGPGASEEAVTTALGRALGRKPDDDLVQDLELSLGGPLDEAWRLERADAAAGRLLADQGLKVPRGGVGQRFRRGLEVSLLDLDTPEVLLPSRAMGGGVGASVAAAPLKVAVNGLPVMHRGLSRSVRNNQFRSLAFALVLVVLIMSVLFRSLWSGLLVSVPTLVTLLVIYGGMGVLGVHLDIGTSMLASIILGAGVDYAVHLAAAWRAPPGGTLEQAAAVAAEESGPAIWTNAVMVSAGFFVLTLGEARPLQNVGGLTAAAMITAALATFLAFPALARKLAYRRDVTALAQEDQDLSGETLLKHSAS